LRPDAVQQNCGKCNAFSGRGVDNQGPPFAKAVEKLLGAKAQIAKRSELHTFIVVPQHWVVECSFAWLEKYRRRWKTASENSTPVYSLYIWPSWLSCLKDREQALRPFLLKCKIISSYCRIGAK
jgi:hypothetical protein